jgi:hypothetical protein
MSWFDRQSKSQGIDLSQSIGRYLRAAGIDSAIQSWCGPFGVRRILIHFQHSDSRVEITNVESIPLQYGGGTPPDLTREHRLNIEKSLLKLHQNMSVGPSWSQGVLGFIRNHENQYSIVPFFDEDISLAQLDILPVPPEGHPLESPGYRRMLGSNESQMAPVWARTHAVAHEWEEWEIDDKILKLYFGSIEQPTEIWQRQCQVLATLSSANIWAWQCGEPLFNEPPFNWQEFACDYSAAMELGGLCTARLGADWLFVSSVEDSQLILLVAVWEPV